MIALIPGIMNTMLTHDSRPNTAQHSTQRTAMIGAGVGVLILVVLFVAALVFADSVLGWVLAGLILGWLGLVFYLVAGMRAAVRADSAALEKAARSRVVEQDKMLTDKLAHSFQIVLVQSKEISRYLNEPGSESRDMIDRALDTINTTASNGMGMVKEEMGANYEQSHK